jgi:hypothetical protein
MGSNFEVRISANGRDLPVGGRRSYTISEIKSKLLQQIFVADDGAPNRANRIVFDCLIARVPPTLRLAAYETNA